MFGRFIFYPFLMLIWIVPIVITIWFLLKIQSIDSTLREISQKIDHLSQKNKNEL